MTAFLTEEHEGTPHPSLHEQAGKILTPTAPSEKHFCRVSLYHGKESSCKWQKSLAAYVLLPGGCTHSMAAKLARRNSWRSPAQLPPRSRTMANTRAGQPWFRLTEPEDPQGQREHSLPGCPFPPALCRRPFPMFSLALPRPAAGCETPQVTRGGP